MIETTLDILYITASVFFIALSSMLVYVGIQIHSLMKSIRSICDKVDTVIESPLRFASEFVGKMVVVKNFLKKFF